MGGVRSFFSCANSITVWGGQPDRVEGLTWTRNIFFDQPQPFLLTPRERENLLKEEICYV